jgi:hypothetical protein
MPYNGKQVILYNSSFLELFFVEMSGYRNGENAVRGLATCQVIDDSGS